MNHLTTYMVLSTLNWNGKIYNPEAGDKTVDLPDDVAQWLLGMDEPAIATIETADTQGEKKEQNPESTQAKAPDQTVHLTMDDIVNAIGDLDDDEPEHWTKSGKPDASVLSKLLDHPVSAAERDEAWEKYQAQQV